MWLQACPRCQGDLYLRDFKSVAKSGEGKVEIVCLQCGCELSEEAAERLMAASQQREKAA